MKLSVVIPCYNEEENVENFLNEFSKVFKKNNSYELIYVNDGSSDNTIKILKKMINSSKTNIKVIDFSRNFGKDAAIYAGLKEASGDYVSIIDADLQQRPEVLLDMYNYLIDHDDIDCVCAFQDIRNEGKVLSYFKNSFYKLINKISDVRFVRGASDFRVFKKNVRDSIIALGEKHRFTKGIFSYLGFNTYYMPYKAEKRTMGVSKWSFVSLFKYAILGILSFSTLPLKIATFLGTFSLIGSFIYLIISLIVGVNVTTMLMFFMISFFGGAQLLAIGIFSEYMAIMYGEVKDRPVYIAREIISNYKK